MGFIVNTEWCHVCKILIIALGASAQWAASIFADIIVILFKECDICDSAKWRKSCIEMIKGMTVWKRMKEKYLQQVGWGLWHSGLESVEKMDLNRVPRVTEGTQFYSYPCSKSLPVFPFWEGIRCLARLPWYRSIFGRPRTWYKFNCSIILF